MPHLFVLCYQNFLKMDSGTIITTIVFIAVVALPFILTGLSKKRKKNALLQKISEMAATHNSGISEHEFCSDFVLGFDSQSNQVFYYKKNDNREVAQQLSLTDYKSCKAVTYGHTISENKNQYHVTDKLELCFYPFVKEKGEASLDIYNGEFDRLTLTGELQFVEKWEKIMNERIKIIHKSTMETGGTIKLSTQENGKTQSRKSRRAS
jgi:hypothetical protein